MKISGPYPPGKALEYTFSFARIWDSSKSKLNYLERKATRSYSLSSAKHWAEHEVSNTRSKRFILAYVMMFMAGDGIDWAKLGVIYRSDLSGRDPARRAKHLFKQEAFQRMIQEKMIEVFKGKNKTEGDVIDMLDKSFAMAEKVKNPTEMRKATENYIQLFDMMPEKQPQGILPYSEEVDWEGGEIAGEIDAAQKKLP